MKKLSVIVMGLMLILASCGKTIQQDGGKMNKNGTTTLPKALFLTTGANNGNGKLPQGAVVAIQSLNRHGVPVRIESRDILLKQQELENYTIIILMSAIGYHDADRQYSLTYMNDEELNNLRKFVANGGVLIAGDNIGRNYYDGTDRISVFKELTPENWPLSECLGINLMESNLKGYSIISQQEGLFNDDFRPASVTDNWTLAASKINSNQINVMASWAMNSNKIPAMIQNRFKLGTAYLLPSSYYLHPANDGGYWSASQIQSFYDFVIEDYMETHNLEISVNPWPKGFDYAFCVSLNSEGKEEEFRRLNSFLKKEDIKPVYFVGGTTLEPTKTALLKSDFALASNAYSKTDFTNISYPLAKQNLLLNQNEWNTRFTGFRFPFTRPGFWGLFALSEMNYQYESSIGAENLRFFNGSVVPYNIPISYTDYYSSTDIMEISPTYHDDYYFLSSLLEDENYTGDQLQKDVRLYEQYLLNYWDLAVKPYNGQMTFLGHPAYSGYNDTTLIPLQTLVSHIQKENVWISTMEEIANFRSSLNDIQFEIEGDTNQMVIKIIAPINVKVKGVSLKMKKKPKNYSAQKGDIELKEYGNNYYLIFDAFNVQQVQIVF